MLELSSQDGIFIGFKLETSLRHQLDALEGPERRYVSEESSDNLRVCRLDGDLYVGKLIHDGLSTARVEDVRRNILSIMQRLFPDVRLPTELGIFSCRADQDAPPLAGERAQEGTGA